MSNNIKRDEPDIAGGLLWAACKGLIVGIIVVGILTLIMSAVALNADDPSGLIGILAAVTLCVGAVSDGFAASKFCPENAVVSGIAGGAAYVMLMWLISLFLRGESGNYPLWMTAAGYAVCLLLSFVGALIGKPKKQRVGEGKNSPVALARRQLKSQRR